MVTRPMPGGAHCARAPSLTHAAGFDASTMAAALVRTACDRGRVRGARAPSHTRCAHSAVHARHAASTGSFGLPGPRCVCSCNSADRRIVPLARGTMMRFMMGRAARRVLAAGGGAAPRLLAAVVLHALLLPGAMRSEESSRAAAAWGGPRARGPRGRACAQRVQVGSGIIGRAPATGDAAGRRIRPLLARGVGSPFCALFIRPGGLPGLQEDVLNEPLRCHGYPFYHTVNTIYHTLQNLRLYR